MRKSIVLFICCFIPSTKLRVKIRKKCLKKPIIESEIIILNQVNTNWGINSYAAKPTLLPHTAKIGKYCSIGPNVALHEDFHPAKWLSTHPFQYSNDNYWKIDKTEDNSRKIKLDNAEQITIENDVWIGRNACIQKGVTVHNGAIIGSNAVVTKDVPPYAIVAGVPARIITYRFPQNIIDELQKLQWWDMDEKYLKNITWNDVEKAISELKTIKKTHNLK